MDKTESPCILFNKVSLITPDNDLNVIQVKKKIGNDYALESSFKLKAAKASIINNSK